MLEFDTDIFLILNGLHADWLDLPMWYISGNKTWIPFYLLLIYLIIRQLRQKSWLIILAIALTVGLADSLTSALMKPYFARLRPSHEQKLQKEIHLLADENGQLYRGGQYGFASSHAANSFALATFIFLLFRQTWRYVGLLFFWAFLVSYSRIYLGVHYPLDILVGAAIGAGLALGVFWGLDRLTKISQSIRH
ncbi:MAG: phosphatase PAP2 family protein [Microscillaceae bacterium]|jgi:undecaprenyl-diphosphatase|nr:phosphatase PAP2 family protein [Microscillaceae bacterium]